MVATLTRPLGRAIAKALGKAHLPIVLTVPLIVQLLGATAIVSYLFFQHGQETVRELATQLTSEADSRIQFHLETYLNAPHLLNRSNENAVKQGLFDPRDLGKLETFLLQQLADFELVNYTAWSSAQGEYIGVKQLDNDKFNIEVTGEFADWKYYTYAANRHQRGGLLEIGQHYDPRTRPWYQAATRAGKATWSPVYFWFDNSKLAIDAILPVYDARGVLLGVFDTPLNLSQLCHWLDRLNASPSAESFILDRDGWVIASSTLQEPFVKQNGRPKRILAKESNEIVLRETSQYLTQHFKNFNRIDRAQQLDFAIDGRHYFLQVSPFNDQRGLDWLIVTLVPEADFAAFTRARVGGAIALCAIAMILTTASGILTARWIVRPIRRLNASAKSLARGKWDETVNIERLDEVGELSQSFNLMAKKLRSSFAALERQNENLQHLNQELQHLDRTKDEFLANISHELRTPLNGMVGLAESMLDGVAGELSEPQRQNLLMISSSGHRLSKLVNEILDFSKLKHHKLELQLKAVEVCSIVEVVLTVCKTLVGEKPLKLVNAVPENLPLAYADENRLQQILYNLVGNAIKFTESGTVEVSAKIVTEDWGDGEMRRQGVGAQCLRPEQRRWGDGETGKNSQLG